MAEIDPTFDRKAYVEALRTELAMVSGRAYPVGGEATKARRITEIENELGKYDAAPTRRSVKPETA